VLDETDALDPQAVKRVILCAGKVFYDLRAERRERGIEDIAILRLEQLYPFPEAELLQVLTRYPNLQDAVWCQEEPMNQGAWYSSQHHMRRVMYSHLPHVYLGYVGRDASAAPAAGYMALHLQQQERFINEALTLPVASA
jgi:2-oxoglutarate dehydrogenase E1 component